MFCTTGLATMAVVSALVQIPDADATHNGYARLTWGDFDGDGLRDVYATGGVHGGQLLRNVGDGSFDDVTRLCGLEGIGARMAWWSDYDGDGRLDLLVAGASKSWLMRQLPDSTFEDVTEFAGLPAQSFLIDAQWVDYDSDGLPDLDWMDSSGAAVYQNLGDGGFAARFVSDSSPTPAWIAVDQVDRRTWSEGGIFSAPGSDGGQPGSGSATRGNHGIDLPVRGRGVLTLPGRFPPGVQATFCSPGIEDLNNPGSCLYASTHPTAGALLPLGENFFVTPAGDVGIGTMTPETKLDVAGAARVNNLKVGPLGDHFLLSPNDSNYGDNTLELRYSPTNGESARAVFYGNGPSTMDVIVKDGRIGIGTDSPRAPLHVEGVIRCTDQVKSVVGGGSVSVNAYSPDNVPSVTFDNDSAVNKWSLYSTAGGNFHLASRNGSGTVNISGLNGERADLHVEGDSSTATLTIRGGADLVEGFDSGGRVLEPGTVVVIDESKPGSLTSSATEYDRKVVGVVSGAGGIHPGIRLGQEGVADGETPVAMVGRVYVRCSTENGSIRPGDRLTTSSIAGHAMRATDSERSDGAVIGKAMSVLGEGTGLVLAIVNLQ